MAIERETIDHETGEIIPVATVPAVKPQGVPTPYNSIETGQLAMALSAAQGEMESPKRTKQGHFGMYAPLEEVRRVLNSALPKYELCWQQGLVTRGGEYFVRTYVRHSSGEWTASDYPVVADRPGSQGFASGVTMARRYALNMVFGLAAEDDDDGQAAQDATDANQSRPQPRRGRAPSGWKPSPDNGQNRVLAEQDLKGAHLGVDLTPAPASPELLSLAHEKTKQGSFGFRGFYYGLTDEERLQLRPIIKSLQADAHMADADIADARQSAEMPA